jgi:glycosyltransferase involved in cell wall biosynthesis
MLKLDQPTRSLRILGTRGLPAAHGGFETFAEHLALHLVERGWKITVYCQVDGSVPAGEDEWQGVRRVNIAVDRQGPTASMHFDWLATRHAAAAGEPCLTLGYNTAVFCGWLRSKRVPNVINMDGIEWRRGKWGPLPKTWFWLNDWAGCWLGDHLVADHPDIKRHLESRVRSAKITVIPYGASEIVAAPVEPLVALGVEPGRFLSVIARPEPENSLLEIVQGFSLKPRGCRLLVLGNYDEKVPYQRSVLQAASDEVIFPGAIYDKEVVSSLRFHSMAYVHGHQVGGTNPSLVEALGAGNAVMAHDNRFNRWVAGPQAAFFKDANSFGNLLDKLLAEPDRLEAMRVASRARHHEAFRWETILAEYERLLVQYQLYQR